MMKHLGHLCVLTVLLISRTVDAQESPRNPAVWSDSLVGTAIARGTFPGAVVVVIRKDEPAFIKAYGVSSVVQRNPIDPDRTMLQIGSITKLFTAIIAMQLVDEGRLSMESGCRALSEALQVAAAPLGKNNDSRSPHAPSRFRFESDRHRGR